MRRRSAGLLQGEDLLVGADGLILVPQGGFGQVCALAQELDLLFVRPRLRHAFAQEAVEIGETAGIGQHAFEQGQRLGVEGYRAEGLAERGHRTVDVACLLSSARDLVVQTGGTLGAVRAGPVGVGEYGGQGFQGFVVARVETHHVGKFLRGSGQIADLLGQHSPQPEHESDASFGIRGAGQLDLEKAADSGIVAECVVDPARGLDHLEVLRRDLGAQAGRRQCMLDACDLLAVEPLDLGAQFGNTALILGLAEGRGLDLHHLHVLARPALLAVDVLEPPHGLAVGRIAADGVGEVGLGPRDVGEMVDTDLGR